MHLSAIAFLKARGGAHGFVCLVCHRFLQGGAHNFVRCILQSIPAREAARAYTSSRPGCRRLIFKRGARHACGHSTLDCRDWSHGDSCRRGLGCSLSYVGARGTVGTGAGGRQGAALQGNNIWQVLALPRLLADAPMQGPRWHRNRYWLYFVAPATFTVTPASAIESGVATGIARTSFEYEAPCSYCRPGRDEVWAHAVSRAGILCKFSEQNCELFSAGSDGRQGRQSQALPHVPSEMRLRSDASPHGAGELIWLYIQVFRAASGVQDDDGEIRSQRSRSMLTRTCCWPACFKRLTCVIKFVLIDSFAANRIDGRTRFWGSPGASSLCIEQCLTDYVRNCGVSMMHEPAGT